MKNRREFLKISTAGTVGVLALGTYACGSGGKKPVEQAAEVVKAATGMGVGLQLYSIRDAMAADAAGTLKKIADMGYKFVEMASYADGKFYGVAPKEFQKMVEDNGMKVVSSHTSVEAEGITTASAQIMADAHAEIGVEYCVQPWIEEKDRNIETYKRMIAEWNKVGEIMKNVGIQFGYHNHNFEFKPTDGMVPYYDVFLKEMDADLITMELDCYWAMKAGQDPVEMFNKYPGRFQLLHFKGMGDEVAEPFYTVDKDDIVSVGAGVADYKRIYDARETAGMKYFFVEDDNQGNGKPFEGVNVSIDNVKSKIFV
ncbi:sugar phosphate isomerase/epimerase [uncultured Draconibacterium sp.]|uniref:sugar phosphate isomerase/epimerase family protein n=1 Tax=uncultured Draconibacterium sp. TaxID=1573823 RepID=UPI0029C64777|nr:sugar phosphate isomerase/epimerase [uncultured Draconibacterium sp.]